MVPKLDIDTYQHLLLRNDAKHHVVWARDAIPAVRFPLQALVSAQGAPDLKVYETPTFCALKS
jgi:hypothetical protein